MVKTVQGIEQKQSANGNTYYSVSWTDGTNDNIFDDAMYRTLVQAAEKGISVTITKKQNPKNPKYMNVESITLGGDPTGAVPPAPAAAVVKPAAVAPPPVVSHREDSIEAQTAMKVTAEIMKLVQWPPGTELSDIEKLLPLTFQIVLRTMRGEIIPADEDVVAVLLPKPKAKK